MTAKQVIDEDSLPKEQLNLIEHFVADFNTVEQFLRKTLATDKYVPFSFLVREYSRKHAGWGDADLLRTIAGVRNATRLVQASANLFERAFSVEKILPNLSIVSLECSQSVYRIDAYDRHQN